MAVIKKNLKSGLHYIVRVRDATGRWFPARTFQRRVDAERYERELLNQRDAGSNAAIQIAKNVTLDVYWEVWSNQCRSEMSDGWKVTQQRMYIKYVKPNMGNVSLSQVRPVHVGECLARMAQAGFSAQTVMHVYSLLHKMFEDAIEVFEYLQANPVKKRFRPRIHRVSRKFLQPQESRALLAAARSQGELGKAIWIGLLS